MQTALKTMQHSHAKHRLINRLIPTIKIKVPSKTWQARTSRIASEFDKDNLFVGKGIIVSLWAALLLFAHAHANTHISTSHTNRTAMQCYTSPQDAYTALMAHTKSPKTHAQNRINLNTATLSELTSLQGIGTKTAQAIIDYRQSFGRFRHVNDLTHVKGIGTKTLDQNRDRLTVE